MADYKGIYYKDDNNNRQKFYEGGAHFNYYRLYKILEKLSIAQKMKIKRDQLIKNREKKEKEKEKNKESNKSMEKGVKNKNISINISKYNRTERKSNYQSFKSKKKQIKTNLFNIEEETKKNKIRNVLHKIKSIENQNHKRYQSSSSKSFIYRNIYNNKNKKSNIINYKESINKSCNNKNKNNNYLNLSLDKKKYKVKNNIIINNNYYTIINNMTLNNINDMKKLENNFCFNKKNETEYNYNISNFISQTSRKELKDIFSVNTNKKIRSRNQSNNLKHYNKICNSNISYNNNDINYKLYSSSIKNRLNNSFIERRVKVINNDSIKNKKRNIKYNENKNISLKEKIHLFHQKKEALVKQYLNKNIGLKIGIKK